jgi:hypothetical protein
MASKISQFLWNQKDIKMIKSEKMQKINNNIKFSRLHQIVKVALCELVERMGQLGLAYNEFLFLMVILLANTSKK